MSRAVDDVVMAVVVSIGFVDEDSFVREPAVSENRMLLHNMPKQDVHVYDRSKKLNTKNYAHDTLS